jgi:hypothetical protein
MNVKLTLPIVAALVMASVVAGGGVAGSDATNVTATSCYVSQLTSLPVAVATGAPVSRRMPVWRPGC